jgi:Zn-dependent M28 family amino/carboxypeptidase
MSGSFACTVGALVAALAAIRPAPLAAQGGASPARAIAGITPVSVTRHIGVLAHDSLRGRATPSPGLDAAARYVADRLRDAGLRPLGESGLMVRWPLVDRHIVAGGVRLETAPAVALKYGTDFAVLPAGDTRLTGDVVPMDSLTDSAAVRGRIPLVRLPPGRWAGPAHAAMATARRAGAPALLAVVDSTQDIAAIASSGATMDHSANGVPTVLLTERAARRVGNGIALAVPMVTDTVSAPYVVGVLPGRDPRLGKEYVIVTAHLDHLGVGAPDEQGDSIYNGADDNASGVAALIEIARALGRAQPRPRRSIVIFATSGEEIGIRGSEYFTSHPPVPLDRIVADINLDGVGRSWQRDTVSAEGGPLSTLGRSVREVAAAHPDLALRIVDDQWPDRDYFGSSDQIWFARRGVPSVFLSSTGPDTHYHRPSDEAATIDGDITSRIARLAAWLALSVAEAAERPHWDEAARRARLAP